CQTAITEVTHQRLEGPHAAVVDCAHYPQSTAGARIPPHFDFDAVFRTGRPSDTTDQRASDERPKVPVRPFSVTGQHMDKVALETAARTLAETRHGIGALVDLGSAPAPTRLGQIVKRWRNTGQAGQLRLPAASVRVRWSESRVFGGEFGGGSAGVAVPWS